MIFYFKAKQLYDDSALGRVVKSGEEFYVDDTARAITLINHGVVEVISIDGVNVEPATEPDPAPRTRRTRTTEE